jgi:hypothetical protein
LLVLIPQILYVLFSDNSKNLAAAVNPGVNFYSFIVPREQVFIVFDIGRLNFWFVLLMLGAASGVHILRRYRLNYVHILGIQPYFQLTHHQLYAQSMLLFGIFAATMLVQ